MERCTCLEESRSNQPRSKFCFTPCKAQMEILRREESIKKWEEAKRPGMERITQEDLKKMLEHIPSEVREYRGESRRYYLLVGDLSDRQALSEEAASILYPEMRMDDPEVAKMVVEYFGPFLYKKIEEFNGTAWVRTTLV